MLTLTKQTSYRNSKNTWNVSAPFKNSCGLNNFVFRVIFDRNSHTYICTYIHVKVQKVCRKVPLRMCYVYVKNWEFPWAQCPQCLTLSHNTIARYSVPLTPEIYIYPFIRQSGRLRNVCRYNNNNPWKIYLFGFDIHLT